MSTPASHPGSCHCGQVTFQVELDLTQPVIACNCSMCQRAGTLLAFTSADRFQLLSGEAALREYRFNQKVINQVDGRSF